MAERRTLAEGLEDTIDTGERAVEEQFVFGKKAQRATTDGPLPAAPTATVTAERPAEPVVKRPASAVEKPHPTPLTGVGRVPVGARIRTELATALKRASLERQLQGIEPNSLQDILEEAIEPWLRRHGYVE